MSVEASKILGMKATAGVLIGAAVGAALLAAAGAPITLPALALAGVSQLAINADAYAINRLSAKADQREAKARQALDAMSRGTTNHDVQRLIFAAVALVLRERATHEPRESRRRIVLEALATDVDGASGQLTESSLPPELRESNIGEYFDHAPESIKATPVMDIAGWRAVLEPVANAAKRPLSDGDWSLVGEVLSERFAAGLYATAKTAAMTNDPAWPGLLLRLLAEQRELLEGTFALVEEANQRSNGIRGDTRDIKADVRELKAVFARFADAGVSRLEALHSAKEARDDARYQSLFELMRQEGKAIRLGLSSVWTLAERSQQDQAIALAKLDAMIVTLAGIATDAKTGATKSTRAVDILEGRELAKRIAEEVVDTLEKAHREDADGARPAVKPAPPGASTVPTADENLTLTMSWDGLLQSTSPTHVGDGISQLSRAATKGMHVDALANALRGIHWEALLSLPETRLVNLVPDVVNCLYCVPDNRRKNALSSLAATLHVRQDWRQSALFVGELATLDTQLLRELSLPPAWFEAKPSEDAYAALQRAQARTLLQGQGDKTLRVGLDLWPGYFPLFSIRERLAEQGISLVNVESSSRKVRMLQSGQLHVIGTTPGCLLGPARMNHEELRVVALLNQSNGSDKILYKGAHPPQLDEATWIVAEGSTAELLARDLVHLKKLSAVPKERWIRARGYDHAFDLMTKTKGPVVCSTWEPYASWIDSTLGNVQVVHATGLDRPLVFDCLVCHRTATNWTFVEAGLTKLLAEWDACVGSTTEDIASSMKKFPLEDMKLELDDVMRMIGGVEFFKSTKGRDEDSANLLGRAAGLVGELWGVSDASARWNSLVSPPSKWLARSTPICITTTSAHTPTIIH